MAADPPPCEPQQPPIPNRGLKRADGIRPLAELGVAPPRRVASRATAHRGVRRARTTAVPRLRRLTSRPRVPPGAEYARDLPRDQNLSVTRRSTGISREGA